MQRKAEPGGSAGYRGPLQDVRVLDLTRVLAGPYGTSLLADLGADVIKVEQTRIGDSARLTPPLIKGISTHFANINRNKRSVAIDLAQPDGRRIFLEMVKQSDIVMENFRPGTMARLQIDYAALAAVNPRIILCSISGFGQSGPLSQSPSYDVIIQALSGAMSVTGEQGRAPVRMGMPMGDLSGGLFGAIAVLAALHERERTGRGQQLDVSMLDAMLSMMLYYPLDYLNTGRVAGPVGGRHEHVAPYGVFRVSDGYMVLALFDNKFWRLFTTLVERSELAEDPRFKRSLDRLTNKDQLYPIMDEIMLQKDQAEWSRLLSDAGIPNAPILTVDEVTRQPVAQQREMFVRVKDETAGDLHVSGRPIKLADRAQPPIEAAPRLGEHTFEVLQELAAVDPAEATRLEAGGVIFQHGHEESAPSQ